MAKQTRHLAAICAALLGLTVSAAAEDEAAQREALIELTREVVGDVEALRGWKFKHEVKTDIRTRDELLAYMKEKIAEEYGPGRMSRKQAMLRMVGLIPADCDMVETLLEVLASQIGGFYDPDKKTFYMMIREGVSTTGAMGRIVIAHELTHALDDQYVDLSKMMDAAMASEDSELAIGAVVEGSATVLMTRYMVTPPYNQKLSQTELAEAMAAETKHAETFLNAPRYFSVLMANYVCGMQFMIHGKPEMIASDKAGPEMQKRVLQATANPPRSAEQILHPEKYWDKVEEPVVVRDAVLDRIVTDSGLHVVHRDTLGEVHLGVLTKPVDEPINPMAMGLPNAWTTEAATGWGGDRFLVLSRTAIDKDATLADDADLFGLWITAWDSESDREEFVEDYEFERDELPRERRRHLMGERVAVYTFGLGQQESERLGTLLEQAPGLFTQAGSTWSAGR